MSHKDNWTLREHSFWSAEVLQQGQVIAKLLKDVDGYWYLADLAGHGLWDEYGLREFADYLRIINEPWNKEVEEGLRNA